MLGLKINQSYTLIFLFLAIFLLYFVISIPYYSGDVKNHLAWANSLLGQGPLGFYQRDFKPFIYPNYPPVAMALFAASLWIYERVYQLAVFLNNSIPVFPSNLIPWLEWENVQLAFLKFPAVISAIGLSYSIFLFVGLLTKKNNFAQRLVTGAIFVLNPATIYLSAVWGQIDFLPIMFLLFGFYAFLKSKVFLSATLMTMALLSKPTVLVFLPIYFFLVFEKYGYARFFKILLLTLGLFYLFYLPFYGFSITQPFEIYAINMSLVAHSVGENTINSWGYLYDFKSVSDETSFMFLTLQQWGYLIFSVLMFLPAIKFLRRRSISSLVYFLFLITMTYFFVLTRMHERYLAPVIAYLSLLTVLDKKFWWGLIFMSLLYLLNLYRGLWQPDITIFNTIVGSLFYLRVLVVGYVLVIIYYGYSYLTAKEKNEKL